MAEYAETAGTIETSGERVLHVSAPFGEISAATSPREPDSKIRALILLNGGTALESFSHSIGRSVCELPVTRDQSLLEFWSAAADACRANPQIGRLPIRVVGGLPLQMNPVMQRLPQVEHVSDPRELRGTGGVLRDVTESYDDEDYLIVASAASLLLEPLEDLLQELLDTQADAAFFASDDGVSAALMLIRRRCLLSIPEVGFSDLKEQAMPQIASASNVVAIRRSAPIAMSLRTPADYIRALRALNEVRRNQLHSDPFHESWEPAFQVVEPGATAEPGVRLHDSVVLSGAVVQRDAVVVRSVVCPGAVIRRGQVVVDQLVRGSVSPKAPPR